MRFECNECGKLLDEKQVIVRTEVLGVRSALEFYCEECYKKIKGRG